MTLDNMDVSVQVRSNENRVSNKTAKLGDKELESVTNLVSVAVTAFQEKLQQVMTEKPSEALELTELELTFGVDLRQNGGLSIASIFQWGMEAGAAFQVKIKMTRQTDHPSDERLGE